LEKNTFWKEKKMKGRTKVPGMGAIIAGALIIVEL
jgi:hypothetical protein